MTAAIVHYHLGAGGVSQVIAEASRALTAAGIRHVILVGEIGSGQGARAAAHRAPGPEPSGKSTPPPLRTVPGLGYLTSAGDITPSALVAQLRAAAIEALGQPPDIWHFHNHSLGKNPLLGEVVARLAAANERIVLQIHDLAENGRPANYQAIAGCREIYPISPRIHYAFLNSRDRATFTAAGLPPEHSSVLANPIRPAATLQTPGSPVPPLLFAPVRAIRRKNPGELVFLSAMAPAGARFAISRAPRDPEALAIHDRWSDFARRQRLPIGFDVVDRFAPAPGASGDFESWLAHATHIVTTSVAEGFGLPLLEAAAHDKPLVGRNLAHLTSDHARHGIRAGDLYDQLLVPAEWIDLTILRDHLQTTLERNFRCYGRHLTHETAAATFESLIHDGWLDFGNLPEPLQQGVIERIADPDSRNTPLVRQAGLTRPAADWLAAAIKNLTPAATLGQLAPYSPAIYQEKLTALYSRLALQPPAPARFVSPEKILTAHLAPGSFHFLLSAIPPASAPPPYRAVVFDIYGTLLIAPGGGVKPDPDADPLLREILRNFGHEPPDSPSTELHAAVVRHHAAAGVAFPEVDLRVLWRELLGLDPGTDTGELVEAVESSWHPARPMPGAAKFVQQLARSGISLGLLSNAQCNTLALLGGIADLFAPELSILSYQHGIAKPSPDLFQILTDRLAGRGIAPSETLFIGNDPLHDIAPAAAHGFKTALFTGHPESLRPGDCQPDLTFTHWTGLGRKIVNGAW